MTINTEPGATNFVAELATAASVMWSSVSRMISVFISFGETHGTDPAIFALIVDAKDAAALGF
jgi:hypothetical protein